MNASSTKAASCNKSCEASKNEHTVNNTISLGIGAHTTSKGGGGGHSLCLPVTGPPYLRDEREGREVLKVLDEAHEHQPRHAQEDDRRLSELEERVQVSIRQAIVEGGLRVGGGGENERGGTCLLLILTLCSSHNRNRRSQNLHVCSRVKLKGTRDRRGIPSLPLHRYKL